MQFTVHDNIITITVPVTLTPVSQQDIQQALQQAGYGRWFILQEPLDNLLAEYQQQQQHINDNPSPEPVELTAQVAERRPAQLHFDISNDRMSVSAIITAAWGGQPVSANDLVKAAQEAGIVYGFMKEQIIRIIAYASKALPGTKAKLVIARGRPVINGQNSRFEPLIPEMECRPNKPQIYADEKADLRDFGAIPSVLTGDPVMRRHVPTTGTGGLTVDGQVIPATPGDVIEWTPGPGTEVSADDPDLLLAAQDGLPRITEAGAVVDQVFTVKNVDLATGHIIFRGSVIVNGDVSEGMKVIAGGDIFVKGFFEGALLEAGGNVRVAGPVIGHQLTSADYNSEYSTEIRAKGDILCNLAQYVRFQCEGNLYVNKQLMHSFVSAAQVYAGVEGKANGKIIGGYFYLDKGLECGNLGSPASSPILISLNRLVDPIMEKQQVLRDSVNSVKTDMEDIRVQLENLKKIESSAQTEELRQQFVTQFEEHKTVAKALIGDIKQLEQQKQELLATLQVKVHQQLFSAVEMRFGTEVIRSRREYGPSKVSIADGTLAIEPFL